MASNVDKIKEYYNVLLKLGVEIYNDIADLENVEKKDFLGNYEDWYSQSLELIKQILPDRLVDFKVLYKREARKEITAENYAISDYINGIVVSWAGLPSFDTRKVASVKVRSQVYILKAIQPKLKSSIYEIKQLLRADLFDSELDAARELLKSGFIRPAGSLAGVVIEKHLSAVCESHQILIQKKDPGINDYNEKLKSENIIDIPTWRGIQRLGDLRNLCDHDKKREPIKQEIEELIEGVDKILKTVN